MLKILSKETDTIGIDRYLDNNDTLPRLFRPSLTHETVERSNGTSVTSTVMSVIPAVDTVDGVKTSQKSHRATFKFFADQTRVDAAEKAACIDNLIKYVTVNKQAIIDGTLPPTATTFSA